MRRRERSCDMMRSTTSNMPSKPPINFREPLNEGMTLRKPETHCFRGFLKDKTGAQEGWIATKSDMKAVEQQAQKAPYAVGFGFF